MKTLILLMVMVATVASADLYPVEYEGNGVDCDSWAYQGSLGKRRAFYIPRTIRESVFTLTAMKRMPKGLNTAEKVCVRVGLQHVFQLFEDACTGKRKGSGPPALNKEIGFDGALYASIGTVVIRCKVEN